MNDQTAVLEQDAPGELARTGAVLPDDVESGASQHGLRFSYQRCQRPSEGMTSDQMLLAEDGYSADLPYPSGSSTVDEIPVGTLRFSGTKYYIPVLAPGLAPRHVRRPRWAMPTRESGWLTRSLAYLRELSVLPGNWDGEGSPSPSAPLVAATGKLLVSIHSRIPADLGAPFICPTAAGGIQMEWTMGRRHFELEFLDADTLVYGTVDEQDGREAVHAGELPAQDVEAVCRRVSWVVSN